VTTDVVSSIPTTLSDGGHYTLPHVATHCNTLQHTATHNSTQQHTLYLSCITIKLSGDKNCMLRNTLQYAVAYYRTLQHTAPHTVFIVYNIKALRRKMDTTACFATHCNIQQQTLYPSSITMMLSGRGEHDSMLCNPIQHTAKHCTALCISR